MTADPATDARHRALLAEGQAALNRGDFARVRALCDEIFAIAPGSVNGFWLHVMSGRVAPGDPVFARIEVAAARDGLADGVASQLQFMLGKGRDDMGDHAGAFAAFVAANRLKGARFDPVATRRLAEAVAGALSRPWPALPAAPPRLVFVLGMPRSGTSLAAQMLGRHPDIENLGEQTALGAAVEAARGARPLPDFLRGLDAAGLDGLRAAYLAGVGAAGRRGTVLVDKMPENYWFAGLIPALFPDAPILHMRRPRLATCWSCFRNDFRAGHAYAYDFAHVLAQYDTHLRLTGAARPAAGARWHEIELETLARAPRATLAPVLDQLGLPWNDACLAPQAGGTMATLSKWQVRQGIDPALPDGWRAYLPFIEQTWGVSA